MSHSLGTSVFMLATISAATPAFAQRAGAFEIGGFGRYSYFDRDRQVDDKIGGGGRFGIFFVRNLALEADASYTSTRIKNTGTKFSYVPIRGRITYHVPLGANSAILIGAGYVHNDFRKGVQAKEDGATGLLGLRLGITNSLAFRVEGTADYLRYKSAGTQNFTDLGVQAGLSLLLGNRHPPKDSDFDGVPDPADRCPSTRYGEKVDPTGCPVTPVPPPAVLDGDRDGVPDTADKCPRTPAGDTVDANGCSVPRDTDGDGVPDTRDRCANTPAGDQVDATGCTPPKDADRDGIYDSVDQCANTPSGESADANGCSASQRDGDKDGVSDDKDKCPNTQPGEKVDAAGCPTLFVPGKKALILQGVNFETGKSVLLPPSLQVLDGVAESLVANPEVRVEVAGYTDNRGSKAVNLKLSQARAQVVLNYLIGKGVTADRLSAKGYGPITPVAPNTSADGRAKNRRVELHKKN